MLRVVAFQNFIHFRDHHSLKLEDGPNFIVGPNASGKSAIFELIRRCLSNSASASTSRLADKNSPAFVLCKFEIREKLNEFPAEDAREVPVGCHVYSCHCIRPNKQTNTKEMYKLVCIANTDEQQQECHLEYYSSVDVYGPLPRPKSFTLPSVSTELLRILDSLINSEHSLETLHGMMTKMMEDNQPNEESGISNCEDILQAIHNVVVATFPIRSPGPIQWSHSPNIGKGEEHYDTASNKAEILQALLNSKDVNEKESNKIFETIIHPLKYQFKKKPDSTIIVNDGVKDIPFLKVPDGIIEAKQFSLMFAHTKYQTLLLEEPARGMHPHMIQKLRDLVFRTLTKDQRKVLLITTHQTTMVNQWSMSRMFICRRTNNTKGVMNHCVVSLKQINGIYEFEDILKEMVFSEAVLFVEGFTDKKIIRSVFDRVLDATVLTGNDGLTKTDLTDFQQMAARNQIISIGGTGDQERIKTLQEISDVLKGTCVFLFDRDKKYDCLAELQPKDIKKENLIKWKNRASFCARTLFKKTIETPNSKQNNEDKKEEENCESVMKTPLTTGKSVLKELGFEKTLKTVEAPMVVSFIERILLPETEERKALSKKKAEEREALSNEKAEAETNHFLWNSGNLEDVICRSLLGDQQEETNVALLQKMFECKHHEGKGKNAVKEKIKEMDIETANELSTWLLKKDEMRKFLKFLSDQLFNSKRTNPNNK